MNTKHFTLALFASLFCFAGWGQTSASDRADKLFDKFNYAEALDEYFYQHERDTADVHVNRQIGLCLRKLGLIAQSTEWFWKVIDEGTPTPDDKLHYAEGLRASGEYDQAVFWYRRYKNERPEDRRAQLHLSNPMYYENLLADSLRYDMHHLEVNTDRPSFGMTTFNDRFVFSSAGVSSFAGETDGESELAYLDLYTCDIDDRGEFINIEPLEGEVDSRYHDGPACFDATNQLMYITRNNMKGNKPVYDKSGTANLKIYTYRLEYDGWVEVPELPFNSPEYSVGHPSVSPDGAFIIFVSNMPGGYGNTDLYLSYREGEGWSQPINLGPEINTEGSEMFPYISKNGHLYFSSDGHAGLGGMDLFVAVSASKNGKLQFEQPINFGAPVNSRFDDFSLYYNEADEWGYFASNRGGLGRDNLYRFTRKQFTHQIYAAALSSREHVSLASRNIRLRTVSTGLDSLMRLDETGSFRALCEAGESYEVYLGETAKEGEKAIVAFSIDEKLLETYRYGGLFMIEKDDLLIAGLIKERVLALPVVDFAAATGNNILERLQKLRDSAKLLSNAEYDDLSTAGLIDDSELEAMFSGQDDAAAALNREITEQRLNNVHYGFDSFAIRSSERSKVAALTEILQENQEARVVIKAHTDSRGDENYNLLLSMRRAKSLKEALTQRGVDESRIKIAWVGSSELLVDCGSKPCSQADHALNRRAEIVVISESSRAQVEGE